MKNFLINWRFSCYLFGHSNIIFLIFFGGGGALLGLGFSLYRVFLLFFVVLIMVGEGCTDYMGEPSKLA